jgi:hypothetical protein
MSTATVNPDPTVTRTIIEPDLSKPQVGQPTVVAFFGGDHTVRLSLAHVLAIGPVDPVTGQPTLTLAYPTEPADPRKLGTVRWSDGYTRVTGVQHASHPDVKAGKVSVAWSGSGAIEIENAPELPQPEGPGSDANPIFQRHVLNDEEPGTAVNEAIAAQRGLVPEGSHVSPATSEAGTTHDATVAAAEPATQPTAAASGPDAPVTAAPAEPAQETPATS